MDILLETAALVVVDKPAGLPTIPDRFGSASVHDLLAAQIGVHLWIVHRLDREVTGILVFAKTAEAHRALSMAFERHAVHKTYEAWTTAASPPEKGAAFHWENSLLRGKKRAYVHPAGKLAITEAVCQGGAPLPATWRFALQPQTGRSHQLRVHLANAGMPIVGDTLYGSNVPWRPQEIALRAVAIAWPAGVLGATAFALEAPGLAP